MPSTTNASRATWLRSQPKQERQRFLASLSDEEIDALEYDWRFWGRPTQFAPDDDQWQVWLILAGRGFGKTRSGAEWVRSLMCGSTPFTGGVCSHIALVGETAADVRDVMVGSGKGPEEASGILQVHPKDFCPVYTSSLRRLTWPNGAIATLYNATEPDQLRGPQHGAAWADEIAKWRYLQETWDQLQFGLRIGRLPRICATTTPKPIKLLKQIKADPLTRTTGGSTRENADNLSPIFVKTIESKYAGTRLGRQELDAEILDDVPGALWSRTKIEEMRVKAAQVPALRRIVVAIDPSASSGEDANEAGVICAGEDYNGHVYILDDASRVMTPTEWAKAAVDIYRDRRADLIVGEANNGGDMVETTVRVADPNVAFKKVHASRGKAIRAEPVSLLYEKGLVHHVGAFPVLEDQMCAFTPDFDRGSAGYSPDRMDALVWALTELKLTKESDVFDDMEVLIPDIAVPRHWDRVAAMDVTRERISVVWGMIDRSSDVAYLYGEYSERRGPMAVHADAIRKRGGWIPCVFEPKARDRSKDEGIRIVDALMDLKVDVFEVEGDVEASIEEMGSRISSRRLKVFGSMSEWKNQYRNFRRDEKGEPKEVNDGLIRATALLVVSGPYVAVPDVALRQEADDEASDATRSSVTGY